MRPYIAQTRSNLRLMGRDRSVLMFSYMFPLIFFFVFSQAFHAASSPGAMSQVIAMVLIIGVLGNGFFGAGMRTVQDRETNVLRRFKVTPTNAAPIIVASMISGLVAYLPVVFLFLFFGKVIYHSPVPPNVLSLLIFVSIGLLTFRALGMVVASVVNSAQEGQLLIQILYLPMLFLSGATFPVSIMPEWLQSVAQFLPATYLFQGIQAIMIGGESVLKNVVAVLALATAMLVALFVGVKLFRWEKEEKIQGKAKLWILVVLAPFFLMGLYQAHTKQNIEKARILEHEAYRKRSILLENVKIFVGNGPIIPNGSVLIKNGKIEQVFSSPPVGTKAFNATVIDESGKTLLPGLIDMRVHISAPGGVYTDPRKYTDPNATKQRLAAYLFSGVTAVRSTGDQPDAVLRLKLEMNSGKYDGAEFFSSNDGIDCQEQASSPCLIPGLSAYEALGRNPELLNRSLLQQAAPADLLESTREWLKKQKAADPSLGSWNEKLLAAQKAGMMLLAGSDAGNMLVIHGPAIQHELELWVKAGISPADALQAATYNAAKALHAENRIGSIQTGRDATFILVEGDPMRDISNTEHIAAVYLAGNHIDRSDLLEQFKH